MRHCIDNDLRELAAALAQADEAYDPAERMLKRPFSSPGYHTRYTGEWVHDTRSSLDYTLALLDSGEPERLSRAVGIVERLLSLQDTDPGSDTYGIWSWFLEESLAEMSPPDWNWADFCGTCLIQIAMDHSDRLPAETAERLDRGVMHAARSIMRRDVAPGYTNIALMGTHVTYCVGEHYRDGEVLDYARMRLSRFVEHTREHGAFSEYNSPTYTSLAARIIARMQRDIEDKAAQPQIAWLYDLVWGDIARHYHPPTRQWSGPHSRSYSTLLRDRELAFFQRALGSTVRLFEGELPPDMEANRLHVVCPARYVDHFRAIDEPREVVQIYSQGTPPVVGTTYLDETVSLASVNRGSFWNQQRAIVGYWNGSNPSALQVQVLHDGYDYSSASVFTQQSGPHVLAALVFATDGGDTHPSLDKIKDATIQATDLRLRFQITNGGNLGLRPPQPVDRLRISMPLGDARLCLRVAHTAFGSNEIILEESTTDGDTCIDFVLYQGEPTAINFAEVESAVIVFGLQLAPTDAPLPLPVVKVSSKKGLLTARWETPRGTLALTVPEKPGPGREITEAVKGIDA